MPATRRMASAALLGTSPASSSRFSTATLHHETRSIKIPWPGAASAEHFLQNAHRRVAETWVSFPFRRIKMEEPNYPRSSVKAFGSESLLSMPMKDFY